MDTLIASLPKAARLIPYNKTRQQLRRGHKNLKFYAQNLNSIKKGSRISRIGRHIFEHKHVKRILGTNLALAVMFTSVLPHPTRYPDLTHEVQAQTIMLDKNDNINTKLTIRYPLKTIKINQGYHLFHPGIDFDGVTGDPVYPVMDGVVETVEYSRFSYGNSIVIDHQNGYKSRYAHLSKILVAQGTKVDTFTKIGEVGSTGHSTGDHLHLEIYENGRTVNPLSILSRQSQ